MPQCSKNVGKNAIKTKNVKRFLFSFVLDSHLAALWIVTRLFENCDIKIPEKGSM